MIIIIIIIVIVITIKLLIVTITNTSTVIIVNMSFESHHVSSSEVFAKMNSPDKFRLEWSEFQANLQTTFSQLRLGDHFADVTLVCEDGQQVTDWMCTCKHPIFEPNPKCQKDLKFN